MTLELDVPTLGRSNSNDIDSSTHDGLSWIGCHHRIGSPSLTLDQYARKFDEFGAIPCAEEVARLDNYESQLRTERNALAVVVIYGGRLDTRLGEVTARLFSIRDHLMNHNSIDASRIILLDGGFRERLKIELWIIPSEARPSATFLAVKEISAKDVHLKGPTVRKWEYKCRKMN